MAKITLSKDALTVPTIIFNNGTLSSDESGNLTWNGQQVGGGTLDASGDITFTGLDAFTQYVTFNGGMISNGDIILNGSKLLLANGASVELYTGDGVPLPEGGGTGSTSPGTGNSGESFDKTYLKVDGSNYITGRIGIDPTLASSTIGYLHTDNVGALIAFRSLNYTAQPGAFEIFAIDGSNERILRGKPDGTLTWNGKSIVSVQTPIGQTLYSSTGPSGPAIGYHNGTEDGGCLYLFNKFDTAYKGGFILRARAEDSSIKDLKGRSDGKLTWSNKEVVTTDFLNDINWGSDITKDPYIGINNSKVSGPYIYFRRGDSTTSAGSLELSARNTTRISKTLKLNVDGTLTWCDKNVLTEGSVKSSVIETWKNGTSWYRKYSDGWIEQGGYINSGSTGAWRTTVSLHKAYTSASTYNVIVTIDDIDPNGDRIQNCGIGTYNKTSSSFSVGQENSGSPYASWYACGY